MKNLHIMPYTVRFIAILFLLLLQNVVIGQTDTTLVIQADTIPEVAKTDDSVAAKNEKKKKKNSFKVHVGGDLNILSMPDQFYESNSELGYQLGVAYKSGGFFYWELGARYNSNAYNLVAKNLGAEFTGTFRANQVDIPVTFGINFLSATARLVGLRVFVSAVPSFVISVNDIEQSNVTKNDLNSFMFHGTGGIGVDIAFFFIETGYQYGFTDLFQTVSGSNPGQFFVNLGFRF